MVPIKTLFQSFQGQPQNQLCWKNSTIQDPAAFGMSGKSITATGQSRSLLAIDEQRLVHAYLFNTAVQLPFFNDLERRIKGKALCIKEDISTGPRLFREHVQQLMVR